MNERVSIGGQVAPRGGGIIALALRAWKKSTRHGDPVARDQLARFWIEAEVNRLTNMRASQPRAKGTPGPGGLGRQDGDGRPQPAADGLRDGAASGPTRCCIRPATRWTGPTTAMDLSNPQKAFLRVQANSIEGGTTNIMKNILGERVLGLPGEPRADKDVPWSQVPRS